MENKLETPTELLGNFVLGICGAKADWTPEHFIQTTVANTSFIKSSRWNDLDSQECGIGLPSGCIIYGIYSFIPINN